MMRAIIHHSMLLLLPLSCLHVVHAFTARSRFLIRNTSSSINSIDRFHSQNTPHQQILLHLSNQANEGKDNDNSLNSFFSKISLSINPEIQKVTSEEERLRLEKEAALKELELKEEERALQVKNDSIPYLLLLALQFLPFLGNDRIISVSYFFGLAVCTVYVGGKQVTIEESEIVKKENALAAPIGASISIGLLYLLIKIGLDPGILYAIIVSLFGALSISDIGVPLLRNILPESFSTAKVKVPGELRKIFDIDEDVTELPLDGLSTLILGIACTVGYWSPIAMEQKFILSNFIAWSLAMTSLGAISLGSFQTAAILLGGLFFYDIFWVFGTDVMMTVATKVEAPVKFLFTAPPPSDIDAPARDYNFSVLGLGDVVIPGLFVRFMTKLDSVLKPTTALGYFNSATLAYATGLGLCFGVNEITHAGQPALLYLDPACIGSALMCGAFNGQLNEVWNFEEEQSL